MHLLFLSIFTFCSCVSALFAQDINKFKIELFQGKEIAPYTQEVIKLCHMIYRESPYNYNADDAEYESYLKSYSQSTDAVTCLVFDNEKAIGLAIGIPMLETREAYKTPFLEKNYNLKDFFYIGEFGISPEYRNQGIEEKMYKKIEDFAKKQNFKMLCLWEIGSSLNSTQDSFKETFWKKNGFIHHPELNFSIYWIDIGNSNPTRHFATYWMKPL